MAIFQMQNLLSASVFDLWNRVFFNLGKNIIANSPESPLIVNTPFITQKNYTLPQFSGGSKSKRPYDRKRLTPCHAVLLPYSQE